MQTDKPDLKRKKKKKSLRKKYKWDYILLTICFIIGAIYYISSVIEASKREKIQTGTIDFGNVESYRDKSMVVIRNDKVLVAPSDGYYELIYPEGERVKKGLPVAKSKAYESAENYNYLIELIDNRISDLDDNGLEIESEAERNKINNRLEYLYRTAQSRIQNDEIEYVEKIKKEITALNDKKLYFFPDEKTVSKEQLLEQKEQLLKEKNRKNSTVYSSTVGLVSSYYDGHESDLSILNIKNLTVTKLEKIKNVPGIDYSVQKKKGEPIAVISENFKWYLACEVEPEDIDHIASETPVYIEIEDKRFKAYLEDFYKGEDGKFVGYFRVEDNKFNYYEKRKFDARIIFQSSNGLAIPNQALIEYGGKQGVFIVDITGVAKFIEIEKFSAQNESFAGIDYDPSAQGQKNILKLYDEVILNPKGIEEGQRIK